MTRYRFPYLEKLNVPVEYKKDVDHIRQVLEDAGVDTYHLSNYDIYQMWEAYSNSLCAGWLRLPSDERIVEILVEEDD